MATNKLKSQKLANISRRIRDSIKVNQAKGLSLESGSWGVGYNVKTGEFVCNGESCALTHLVVKEQPTISKALQKRLMQEYKENLELEKDYAGEYETVDVSPVVDVEDEIVNIVRKHLGVPQSFVEEFVAGFDDGEDSYSTTQTQGRRLGARLADNFGV